MDKMSGKGMHMMNGKMMKDSDMKKPAKKVAKKAAAKKKTAKKSAKKSASKKMGMMY